MSHRVKRRYLAVKAESKMPIQGKEVLDAAWNALTRLFGEYGASMAELAFIRDYKKKGYFILRCSLKALPMVRASVASITEISGKPAAIHVLRVSGTLKALRKKTASAELT